MPDGLFGGSSIGLALGNRLEEQEYENTQLNAPVVIYIREEEASEKGGLSERVSYS